MRQDAEFIFPLFAVGFLMNTLTVKELVSILVLVQRELEQVKAQRTVVNEAVSPDLARYLAEREAEMLTLRAKVNDLVPLP